MEILFYIQLSCTLVAMHCLSGDVSAVYHVTADGWKKVRGDDVGELHYEYYPTPEAHPCQGSDTIEAI